MWIIEYNNITKLLSDLPKDNYTFAEKVEYVCTDCGNKYGEQRNVLETWHIGKCDICKKKKELAPVRHFSYLNKYEAKL